MSSWSEFRERNPELAEPVDRLSELLSVSREVRGEGFTLLSEPEWRLAHGRPRVYGAGVWLLGDALLPAVFAAPSLAGEGVQPLIASPVLDLLGGGREVGDRAVAGAYVVPLAPPQAFATPTPGAPLTVGMLNGTTGTLAEREGVRGFVTAGHVAPSVGLPVHDPSGGPLGTVETSLFLSTASLTPLADIAFVRSDAVPVGLPRRALASVKERDLVDFTGQRGASRTWIRGLSPDFILDPTKGGWGEVALTGDAVANQGDSGGPVFDAAGTLVGHIVGGTPQSYSVIQDADYQLTAIGAVAVG